MITNKKFEVHGRYGLPSGVRYGVLFLLLFASVLPAFTQYTIPGGEKVYIGNFDWWTSTPFNTDYTQDNSNPGNGRWTSTRYTNWANNSWPSFEEHTGNNQAMLVGNGHTSANRDIWAQSMYVQAGNTYTLTFWSRAIESNNPPELYFAINGSQVGSTITTDPDNWQLLTVTYTATTSGYITLSIRNQNTSSSGNTFAIDDISMIENITPTCSGNFYDTGGPSGNYSDDEDYYQTFCAPYGKRIRFSFSSFYTRNSSDYLAVYEGTTASGSADYYSGYEGSFTITSNDNCFTFYFHSNGNQNRSGWEASISCVNDPNCEDLTAIEINALSGGSDIDITSGASLYPSDLPSSWNLEGVANGISGSEDGSGFSMLFNVTGDATESHTENALPYRHPGDANSISWGPGIYNIEATLFENNNLGGKVCGYIETELEILNCNLTGFGASVSGSACTGTSLDLSAGSFIGGATYSWTGPGGFTSTSRTPSIPNVNFGHSGNYFVTITSGGCTASSSVAVTVVESPVASFIASDPNCGLNNGVIGFSFANDASQSNIQFSVNGGSSYPYSYADNAGTGNANSLAPGNYDIYVRWPNGSCPTSLGSQVLTRTSGTLNSSPDATICYGNNTTMTASLSNGVGSVTYSWSNGLGNGASKTVSPTVATVYSVTGTDSQGCTASATINVSVNPLPNPNAWSNSPVCAGGTIILEADGGVTYTWTGPGLASTSGNPLNRANSTFAMEGTYTVNVIDGNGCQNNTTTYVDIETTVFPTASVVDSAICVGQNLQLQASGGSSYSWTGPNGFSSTSQNPTITSASSAASGTYTVTVSDAGGCTATATASATVVTPNVIASNDGPRCEGLPIHFTASGGSNYTWSGPDGFTASGQNVTLSNTVIPNSEGTYTVTAQITPVCSATGTTSLTMYALPNVGVSNSGPVCTGENISLNASGGTAYSWSGPNGFISSSSNPTVTSLTNSKTGVYSVTVQNAAGCTASATTLVNLSFPNLVVSSDTSLCVGGTINLHASGGISYNWAGPNSFASTMSSPSISSVVSGAQGVYTVTVANSLGCTATTGVMVYVLSPSQSIVSNSPLCVGDSLELSMEGWTSLSWTGPGGFTSSDSIATRNGLTVADGGTYNVTASVPGCSTTASTSVVVNALPVMTTPPAYTVCQNSNLTLSSTAGISHSWTGPNSFSSAVQNPTFNVNTTAYAGTYSVSLTDANGCSNTATTSLTISSITPIAGNSGTACLGATIDLSAGGGVGYSWSGPNSYSSSSQNPSLTAASNSGGNYTVTVSNAIGCTATATTQVLVSIPAATAGSNSPVCEGQTLNLTSTGGQTYAWTGPSGFSSSQQNPTIFAVATNRSGSYQVSVTDSVGCTATASTNVTINTLPSVSALSNSPLCAGQSLNLTSTAGGSSYSWSGPNGFMSALQNPTITNISNAGGGTYSVQLTDANNCSSIATVAVTVNAIPVATASNTSPDICVAESISLTAGGGSSYSWVGPDGYTSSGASLNRSNATVAMSGTYTVKVTGANGCTASATAVSYVHTPPSAPIAPDVSICGTGTAVLTASGCSGVYTWYNSNSSSTVRGTGATFVTPTLYSSNNGGSNNDFYVSCTEYTCPESPREKVDVTVLEPPTNVTASNTGTHCAYTIAKLFGSATNAASYSWAGPNGFSSNLQSPTFQTSTNSGGVYTLTATAANGCTATATTNLVINTNCGSLCTIYVSLEPTNPSACGNSDGSIRANDFNSGSYELSLDGINWKRSTHSTSNGTISNLGVGTHLVFLRDYTTKIICRTVNATLISNGGSFFTGANVTAASGCFATDGAIELQNVLATDEVSWTGFQDRNYVSVSTLSPANTISSLEPGTYYVRVKRFSSIYCYKEIIVTVPNSGTPCNISAFCSVDSVGNKFVNGDFGSGSSLQGPPLAEEETDYGYVDMNCNSPNDGFYTIASGLDCNGSSSGGSIFGVWDILTEDHTPGDTGGYMMVVNASYEPDVVVEQLIVDLCPNTQYNFTAWVRSLAHESYHIPPNFAFLIDGVGKYTTGQITTAGWQQVGFSFKTGNYTQAVFSIRNNAPGGNGNDWVIDDIVVNKCPLDINLSGTTVACLGGVSEEIEASVTDPLDEFDYYKWQQSTDDGLTWTDVTGVLHGTYDGSHVMDVNFSLPTPVPSVLNGIKYQIVLATESDAFGDPGCVVTSGLTQIVVPPIEMSVTDTIKCIGGNPIDLTVVPSGGTAPYSFTWSHGLPDSDVVSVNPTSTTDYIVTARDADMCPVTDTVTVEIKDQPTLTVTIDEDSVCLNGAALITAQVEGGSGSFNFTWYSTLDTNGSWTTISGADDSTLVPSTSVAGQTYYRVYVEDLIYDCNDAMSNPVLFNVVSDPIISIAVADTSLCITGSVTLNPTITGGTGTLSYQWQSSVTGTGGWADMSGETSQNLNAPASTAGITFYRLTATSDGNGCNYPPSDSARVEVFPQFTVDISITDALLCAGGTLTLQSDTSTASGTITYQWYESSDGSSFSPISGATAMDYTPNTSVGGIDYYMVQATASGAGCGMAASDTALVNVLPVFEVDASIDNALVCIGGSVNLNADTTSGDGSVAYQWLVSTDGTNYSYVSGATSANYSPPTSSAGIRYFKVQATSGASGCGTAVSDSVIVEVLPVFSVDIALDNSIVCLGGVVEFTSDTTNGTGTVTYQWFESSDGTTFNSIPGATSENFTLNTTTAGTYYYYVEATASGSGCGTVASAVAQVQVLPNFSVDINPSDNTVCLGGLVEILADTNSGTGTITYQWYQSTDGSSFTAISGETDSLLTPSTSAVGVMYYRIEASATGEGCGMDTSAIATVEVLPVFDVDVTVDNALVCIGGVVQLTADTISGTGTITYQWYSSTDNSSFSPIPGETDSFYVAPTASEGIAYYQVVATASGAGCGNASSASAQVQVLPVFSVDVALDNATICLGGTVNFIADTTNGTGNISFAWYESTDGVNYTAISGENSDTYSVTPSSEGTYYYYVDAISDGEGCGTVSSAPVMLEVLPNFSVNVSLLGNDVCTDAFVELLADTTSGTGTITYQWYSSTDGVTFSPVTDSTNLSFNPSTGTLGTYYYRVDATASGVGCSMASSDTALVNVYPQMSVDLVPSATEVCEGDPVQLEANPTDGYGAYTYQWQSYDGSSWVDISGETDTLYVSSTTAPGIYQYRVVADAGGVGCISTLSMDHTLTVYDLPNVSFSSQDPLCVPDNGEITFTFNDEPNRSNIEFSIDGGLSYPYVVSDTLGTFTIDTLSSSTYLLYARWGGDFCPVNLGSVTISDRPAPQATVSITDPTCSIDNGTITFTFPDESTRTQLEFSLDSAVTFQPPVNDNLGSTTYSGLAPGTYDLWVRWANDECPVDLGPVTLTDHPSPVLTVTNDTTICVGATVNLLASTTGGDAPVTISWNNGLADGNSHTVSPTSDTQYIITATDNNSCSDTDTINVTVNPLPVITATGGIFCEEDTVKLFGTGGGNYSWSGPSAFTSTDQNPEIVNSVSANAGVYTLTVTDSNSCEATATSSVTINGLPTPPSVTDNFNCGPGDVSLSASGCTGGVITWFDNQYSASVVGFGTTFVTDSLVATKTYFANCTDVNGCKSTDRVPAHAEIRTISNAEVLPINSTCVGQVALDNGVLLVTGFRDGEKYSFNKGTTYDPGSALPVPPALIPVNGRISETIPNPVSTPTEDYTVEIISIDGCPTYQTVQFGRQCEDCLPYCEPAEINRVK